MPTRHLAAIPTPAKIRARASVRLRHPGSQPSGARNTDETRRAISETQKGSRNHVSPSLPDDATTPRPYPTVSSTYAPDAVAGKYALRTYCSTIRWVLKNDPLSAIAARITSAYANGSP